MAPRAAKVVAEDLKLPPDERAQVVDELLRSLDDDDDLEDDDRARLHAALRQSDEEFKSGLGMPATDVLARLHPR